jgi:hypothetical protein
VLALVLVLVLLMCRGQLPAEALQLRQCCLQR